MVGTGNTAIATGLGCAPDPNFAPLVAEDDTWFKRVDYNAPPLGDFGSASGPIQRQIILQEFIP